MLVNGDEQSAMGHRARAFAAGIDDNFNVRIAYRSGQKLRSIGRFFSILCRDRPTITYVMDLSFSGAVAGSIYRMISHTRLVIDTGDAIYELAKSMGAAGWVSR